MHRLRVAMLIKHFPTRQGGAERLLEALIPLLAERGVETTVISRERPEGPRPSARHAEVVQVPVRGGRKVSTAWYVGNAVREVVRTRPDVLHAHSLLSPTSAALLAGKALGIPTVATVHGGGQGGEVERLRALRRGGAPRLRVLGTALDRIVVISEEIDRELADAGVPESRRVAIANGVDTRRFRPGGRDDRAALLAQLGVDQGPVVVFVGRLIAAKGLGELRQAWTAVRRQVPTAQLVLIGEGPLRGELEGELAPEGVHLTGAVPDVERYLRGADVFVLPSHAEGLSIALLEAMASGLAVVATDVGATLEAVGAAGRIVPARDVDALAGALVDVLADGDARAGMAVAARRHVEHGYQLSDTADRLVTLYRSLASERR